MANLVDLRIVLRKDGYFHLDGKRIKARRTGDGYGVVCVFEMSPVDVDFGGVPQPVYDDLDGLKARFYYFPTAEDQEQIKNLMDVSDIKTFKLYGNKGWSNGPRPFDKPLTIRASDVL